MEKIQMRKWYRQMRGYGGCDTIEVAAYAETGRMAGKGVISLFGGKDGGMREHEETPVLKAIDKKGVVCEIEANELQANGSTGIGSLVPCFDIPDLTDEELAELKAKGEELAAKEKAAEEEAKRQREESRAALLKEFAYLPNKCKDGYVTVAKVAENVRVNLKTVFAGVKFGVRSKSFSGGDEIRVEWTNGPTVKMVEEETDKYEDSSNDFTGDYRDYTPSAFNDVFGGTKYMWTERNMQEGFELLVRDFCEIPHDESMKWCNGNYCEDPKWNKYHAVIRAWTHTAFPCGAVITGVYKLSQEELEKANDPKTYTEFIEYGFKYDAPVQKKPTEPKGGKVEKVDGVTVTINEEKKGVEIRFPSKPSAEVLDTLKRSGFRWTRFGKCWYAKDTEQHRAIAYSLAA